ncbi:MAG: efflux RND transporter permease subunit, partial [Desulfobacterales bacterium]
MSISEFSVRKPITMLMIILSIVVLGLLALNRLPLAFMPDRSSDDVDITVPYVSSSPEEVERRITRPIEDSMSTLPHLESISSSSSSEGARIEVEFVDGIDMGMASVAVRDRLDRVRPQLPDDVERIHIRRWRSTDRPIIQASLAWQGAVDELYGIVAKTIVPQLQRIDGVANVEVGGLDERHVLVELDFERMRAHRIDVYDLSRSLQTNNVNTAGGWILDSGRKHIVRTIGEFQSIEEIAQTPIQGTGLVLSDIADVKFGYPEKTRFQRLNSNEAIVLGIFKSSTANVVEVAANVKALLKRLQHDPNLSGLELYIYRDQSEEI